MEAPKRARAHREYTTPPVQGKAPGAGVDASGNPVLDPTANVLALVAAANRRQDDLGALNEVLTLERIKRVEDLQSKEAEHQKAMLALTAKSASDAALIQARHDHKLHAMSTDAIRDLTTRIGPLEKMVYESAAKGAGLSAAWGYLTGFAGLAVAAIMVGVFIFKSDDRPSGPAAPQVYVPAQPGTLVPSSPQQAPSR